MGTFSRNVLMATTGMTMILGSGGAAYAQTEGASNDENVIIVTAQKRAQNIQDVPASVTAASGEQLEQLNVTGVANVEALTPGLLWGEGGSSQWPTIRGVNTAINENIGDPTTAFFVNGVYKSRTAQALAGTVDVERVEILRGPQGTLFGRNATAGAINVITREPTTDQEEFRVSLTAGNFDHLEFSGMANIPLADDLAIRVVGLYRGRDGYVNNIGPADDRNDENMFYGRAAIKYDPGGDFNATIRASVLDRDRGGGGAFTYKVLGQTFDATRGVRTIFGDPVFINPRVNDGIADIVNGVNVGDIGVPVNPDGHIVDQDFEASEETTSVDIDLEFNYDFGGVSLKSITSFADFRSIPTGDNDFQSNPTLRNRSDSLTALARTFTQELQLASSDDSAFEWVVGAYYLNDKTFEIFSITDENGNFGPFPNRLGQQTVFIFNRQTNVDTESIGVFGQGTYRFSDQFSVTGGIRYTSDTKDFRLTELGWLGTLGFNPDLNTTETFDKVTWRVGLEYKPDPDHLIYASVATGFRSGGFNRFADAGSTDANTFDSEQITSYEIGSKNTFADGRMRFNLAAYYSDLVDQQVGTVVSIAGTGQSGFDNAGETEIWGIEAELEARPTDNLFVLATAAYNSSEYKSYLSAGFAGDVLGAPGVVADPATGSAVVDLSGNRTPRSPRFRATLLAGYDFELSGGATITPLISTSYTSSFFNSRFNTQLLQQDGYTKTDLRLSYTTADERFSIEGFVNNVEDKQVISRGTYGGTNAAFASYAAPRTYGVRLTFQN